MVWNPNLVPGSTQVDLTGLTEGTHPLVLEGGEAVLEVDPDNSVELAGYRFQGEVSWSEMDRRVRGFLTGRLVAVCDRCLVPFDRDFRAELDSPIIFAAANDGESEEDVADGIIRVTPSDTSLDLAKAFQAAVLLEEPMKSLCRDDCRGLCPVCGASRNESPCDCGSAKRDPRWDALKDLTLPSDSKES